MNAAQGGGGALAERMERGEEGRGGEWGTFWQSSAKNIDANAYLVPSDMDHVGPIVDRRSVYLVPSRIVSVARDRGRTTSLISPFPPGQEGSREGCASASSGIRSYGVITVICSQLA